MSRAIRTVLIAGTTAVCISVSSMPIVNAAPSEQPVPASFSAHMLNLQDQPATVGQQCPSVTLVLARGSEQNDAVTPQLYSDEAVRKSNGYEGVNFRNMLHQAEQLYRERTGRSLMASVDVLPLNGDVYPASMDIPAIAAPGEELSVIETIKRIFAILVPTPLHVLIGDAVNGFLSGLDRGRVSTPEFLSQYESSIGCSPEYILMGYSQGALVLSHNEKALASQGKLRGVFYMGNPLVGTHSVESVVTTRIGEKQNTRGLLAWLPRSKQPESAQTDHAELCSAGDFACDSTFNSLTTSLASRAGQHAEYFIDTQAYQEALTQDPLAEAPIELTTRSHTADEVRAIDELIRMIAPEQ